jgi:hypothetical protein
MRARRIGRLWAIGLAASALAASPAPATVEHETLARGVEAIVISGDIVDGDDTRFGELSQRYPRAVVYLESAGGALVPGIEIGKLVHAHHHPTAVLDGSTCTSACALIWIAGAPRYLGPEGHLGFHASYSDEGGRLVETGVGNAMVGHYLAQLDLPEDAAVFATIASPYEINWLTAENSGEAGIAFEAVPQSLPMPRHAATGTGTKLAGNPQMLQKAQRSK